MVTFLPLISGVFPLKWYPQITGPCYFSQGWSPLTLLFKKNKGGWVGKPAVFTFECVGFCCSVVRLPFHPGCHEVILRGCPSLPARWPCWHWGRDEAQWKAGRNVMWWFWGCVEFLYCVFTHMPGESLQWSLLLCLSDIFQGLIDSLVCWFCVTFASVPL